MIVYNQNYYQSIDGVTHPAGYSEYARRPFCDSDDLEDQGEIHRTEYWKFKNRYTITGKVLDLGCAYGFFVDDMRSWGVEAYGIDGSEWAISQANEYCAVADALEYLSDLPDNSYDVITGHRFLPCLTDEQIVGLLPHILRVAPKRVFVVDDFDSYKNEAQAEYAGYFYNIKTLDQWRLLLPGCIVESIKGWKCQ